MRQACKGSTPRIRAHLVQLRSTEPNDEIRMPSISKRMPLQRISTGEEVLDKAIYLFYGEENRLNLEGIQRLACVSLGTAKLTFGGSPKVSSPPTTRLREPCCTSLSFSVATPLAISASAVHRSKRVNTPGTASTVGEPPFPAAAIPCRHSKCKVPFAEAVRSLSVKPDSSISPSASKEPPDHFSPSNWPTAAGESFSNWPLRV